MGLRFSDFFYYAKTSLLLFPPTDPQYFSYRCTTTSSLVQAQTSFQLIPVWRKMGSGSLDMGLSYFIDMPLGHYGILSRFSDRPGTDQE
jgi:hypothetical protein